MSEKFETYFPRPEDRTKNRTLVTELPKRVMPSIIVGDDIKGVSPFVGPTPETLELMKKLNKTRGESDAS